MTRTATTLPFTELEIATGNYDQTRAPRIDRIVIHTMVGSWQSAADEFDTYGKQLSAHYGVKLDGGLIHWLEETFTAYHAGSYSMNQRSIGIEHEDNGNYNGPRTDELYTTSAALVHDICVFYNIPIDRQHILKHSEVIPTGCPDALDIDRIVREAEALNHSDELTVCRNDRDLNWRCFASLCTALGVIVDPNDKPGSVKRCMDAITALAKTSTPAQQAPTAQPAQNIAPSVPMNTPKSSLQDGISHTHNGILSRFIDFLRGLAK